MKTKKNFSLFVMLIFCCSLSMYAQGQRGKIAGTVIDAASKEPLIGANIKLKGTTLGGVTDMEGKYVILGIQPGSYSVSATFLGYSTVTQTDVVVNIDRTTELKFQLKETAIQAEEVTIVATKPKIVKDQTATAQTMDTRELTTSPAEGIRGAMDLAASFQKNAQGVYSVRGSGNYEVNFQINGVDQMTASTSAPGAFATDKANNSWKFDVNPLGVQQLQLISGGFSAEYGNAQAGVVKVVTREGSPKLKGEVRFEYRPPGQYHWGPYLYNSQNYEWQKWGTLDKWLSPQNKQNNARDLNLSTRYKDLYEKYYRLVGGGNKVDSTTYQTIETAEITWAYGVWLKNHSPSDDNVLGVYDYREYGYTRYLVGFGGPLGSDPNVARFYFSGEYRSNPTRLPTAEKLQVYQNYLLNVIIQPWDAHKFKLMGMYQNYRGGIWSGSDDIRWSGLAFTPPGISTKYMIKVDPVRTEQTVTQSLNWVHTIDAESYIEATISHQRETYELPYEWLPAYNQAKSSLDSMNDIQGYVLRPGAWYEGTYFREPFNVSTNYYQDNRTEHASVSTDYTNQINKEHLLKMGGRFYYWDMVNNGVNSSYQANTYIARSGFGEYYKAYPWYGSFYAQDKMELSGMVLNLGLRAEIYNFGSAVPEDKFKPFYQGTSGPDSLGDPITEDSKTKNIIMPRFGVSFPIGENTAFRIQYGHFASMPIFSQAFQQRTESGWTGLGNPNLEPKKTINYEFGIQQVVQENYRLDVALYYNDRVQQVGIQRIASYTGSRNRSAGTTIDNIPLWYYTTFSNNAFGGTVGLEATFENVDPSAWKYRLSYSLSQTTDGTYGAVEVFPDNTRGFARRGTTGEFLSGSDRTHSFRALILYNVNREQWNNLLSVEFIDAGNFSLTYAAQSGLPFTYTTDFTLKDVQNNRRYPLESSFDMNSTVTLKFYDYTVIVGVRVMNLFDNKWLTPFDTQEDKNNWLERGITMDNPGVTPSDASRISYLIASYRTYRNIPRQVFFTLGLGF
jgi:hypothetical protein